MPIFFRFVSSSLACIFTLTIAGCGGGGGSKSNNTSSQSNSSITASTYQTITLNASQLANNIVGESTQRQIQIYLPRAYFTSNTSFPVVYLLPGYGGNRLLENPQQDFDAAFNTYQPTIMVNISGINLLGGSFFVDSPITGKWADYVIKDVVNYVDTHYRTLAKPESRGIAGHSMGGFGALDLAMRHPEVFGSVFSLAPGLVGTQGIRDTQLFNSETHIKNVIASLSSITNVTGLRSNPYQFDVAYGVAFAPLDVPPYFEYPYKLVDNNMVLDESILAKWEAGFGAVHNEIIEFKENLKKLDGIQLDCGSNDEYAWIYRGCIYYDEELTAAAIEHRFSVHTGQHENRLAERVQNVMIPFFSQHLEMK